MPRFLRQTPLVPGHCLLLALGLLAAACAKHSAGAPVRQDGGAILDLTALTLRVADQSRSWLTPSSKPE